MIIIGVLFFLLYIVIQIRYQKISIKESFWWVVFSALMLISVMFPCSVDWLVEFLNIKVSIPFIFVICIAFLLFINFNYGKKLSEQQMKIIKLSQTISLLQEKVDSMKEKED